MNKTKIEWCDSTLNPVVGCTHGCDYCYARRLNNRFKWVKDFYKPQFFKERLEKLSCKKSKNIFMNSMSDIADWKDEWIESILKAIKENPQHNYLFLSKRPRIYLSWLNFWKENMWYGATGTGTQTVNEAMYYLGYKREWNSFLSIEPLLNEVEFADSIKNINWVIIGAETGNRKNKVIPKEKWIKRITEQCKSYDIPVFMKNSLAPIIGERNMIRQFPIELKREE